MTYSMHGLKQKPWCRWKLVCINPSYVMGPPIGDRLDGESIQIICDIFDGKFNSTPEATYTIVDVRDVAAAHCLAMAHPQANGRNICCEGTYNVAMLREIMHELYPSVSVLDAPSEAPTMAINNTKLQRELGFKFHSNTTCIQDMVKRLVEIGRIKV